MLSPMARELGLGGEDRRKQRSDDALVALTQLLETARVRDGYRALALADESGLLVAAAGHFAECELLAAQAPMPGVAAGGASECPSHVERLWVDGVRVLVCAKADRIRPLDGIVAGCQRILGRTRAKSSN
jgi:hypothetical protein